MHPSVIPPKGRALEAEERESLLAELEEIVITSHLFKSLDDAGRRDLIDCGYVVEVPAEETIVEQGEAGDAMYLVLKGRVLVETAKEEGSSSSAERPSLRLAELGRGACIGEVALLTGSPRTATVSAIDDVQLVAFEKHRIQRVIEAHPRVRKLLEAMVEGRARDTVEKLIRDA